MNVNCLPAPECAGAPLLNMDLSVKDLEIQVCTIKLGKCKGKAQRR